MFRCRALRYARSGWFTCFVVAMLVSATSHAPAAEEEATSTEETVSFYRQIRPVLQRHCSGCHQPAKKGGKLLLTTYEGLHAGGENGAGFEAGKADESLIMDYITGDDPLMPLNAEPLRPEEVALIGRWIDQGAKDDTPEGLADTITPENPPSYIRPPVITALDYSPDSKLLAVSGFREILLHDADGNGLAGRLVGRSQRIESLSFSPDGKRLGAVGGAPALFGEVQFWDPAEKKLLLTQTIATDTLFGGSFSDDSKLFAFGAADNRARVLNVEDGEQVMRLDAHSDWVLDTTFSQKNDHIVSVSRDMSMKLTIVESGQFVDNVTSITPGALKGGLMAVERHPRQEQVLVGGADGEPKLYKIFRTRARIIGDDFNHIRSYAALPGRIYDLEFNADGSQFVAGASDATTGTARIYRTGQYDTDAINNDGSLQDTRKGIAERSQEDALIHELKVSSPVYAVAFRPDGKHVAIAGFDGTVRLFDAGSGELVKEFVPVELSNPVAQTD